MPLGPIEYIIIAFPGNQFKGEIVPALQELVESKTVRIIDLVFVRKEADGSVSSIEAAEMSEAERAVFGGLRFSVDGLLNEEDIALLADELPNNTSAGLLVWENVWAARFAEAVRNANGQIIDNARIPRDIVLAAMEYTDTHDE